MRLRTWIQGLVSVEFKAAMPQALLNACAEKRIDLIELEWVDPCMLRFGLRERDLSPVQELSRRCMGELTIRSRRGGSRILALLRRRLWLFAGGLAVLAALLFSSFFLWEIRVYGCERLSEGQVLRALSDCGVEQGSYWPKIRTDLLQSQMLTRLPELAWMTVNVSGSQATVLIRERAEKPVIYEEARRSDVVAKKPGVIRTVAAQNGRPVVFPGQVVAEGDLLVSGTVESLTAPPRDLCARAVVMADTWTERTAVTPRILARKEACGRIRNRFALLLGRKRINFYASGQKMLDGYDKIVHDYKLGIKGLFALPVTLLREEYRPYRAVPTENVEASYMGSRLRNDLQQEIDGEVLEASLRTEKTADLLCVTLYARCRENIARSIETQAEK